MVQIHAYLSAEDHAEFTAYAGEFGLDVGGLAHLLFRRELRLGRLQVLAARDQFDGGSQRMKVTARTADQGLKARLQSQAQFAGLSLSRACALLYRTELNERWLERAINHIDSK